MTKKTYLLPEDERAALLAYLMGQPYRDVARGVQMLEALAEVPPAPSCCGACSSTNPQIVPIVTEKE